MLEYANASLRNYLGFDPASNRAVAWTDFLHPDDAEEARARFDASAISGVPFELECRLRRNDGDYRWHGVQLSSLRGADDADRGWIASAVDMDDRRRAIDESQRNERRYRSLFDTIEQGYCVVEVLFDQSGAVSDLRYLEANSAFEKHSGLSNVVGKTTRELIPDLEDHWFECFGRVARTGEPTRFINQAAPLDERWFDVVAFPFGDPESRQVAVLFTDATARKRADEDEARLAAIVESSREAIHGRSLDGIVTSWNHAAEELYGYRESEILGRDIRILFPPDRTVELTGI